MKLIRCTLLSIPLAAAVLMQAGDASACGGCAPPVGESSQVTGHRMLLSISQTETTLWDQIEYSGEPSAFAWFLPIKGIVDIGLSSDAVFAALSDTTRTNILPPPLNCPPPPWCYGWGEDGGSASGSTGGPNSGGGGVTVIAHEVIGPYITVQLSANDPGALKNWLLQNGFNVDADAAPVIDAYVNEGFDFLALKLLPGQGVNSMRPVRISIPGANDTLPLRMVSVGTGAITPITLWTLGEGRYEPANFPSFTIDEKDLVWNWDTSDSNYAKLKDDAFKAANNSNWLTQYAQPYTSWNLRSTLEQLVQILPDQSGYGKSEDNYATAWDELQEDMGKMFNGLNDNSLWLTRMNAELARQSLNKDLKVGASMSQTLISNNLQSLQTTGTPPTCPVYPPCDTPQPPGSNNGGTWWGNLGDGNGSTSKSGCSIQADQNNNNPPIFLTITGLTLTLSLLRRRHRKQ